MMLYTMLMSLILLIAKYDVVYNVDVTYIVNSKI